MASMRVKPPETEIWINLNPSLMIRSAWGPPKRRRGESTVDAEWRRHLA